MLILAFTDTHGDEKALHRAGRKMKRAELVICTGDVTIFENHLKRELKMISHMAGGKKVLMLHGNHETEEHMRQECRQFRNIIFLHKDFYEIGDYLFAGFGGGGFALRDHDFERFAKKINARRKGKKLILLLHGPPYKNRTDIIMGKHAGSKSYTELIRKAKPELVLCGHLHENNGKHDRIGKTLVMNPGPEGRIIVLK
jgi:Icc-related predicted phosphoesterase